MMVMDLLTKKRCVYACTCTLVLFSLVLGDVNDYYYNNVTCDPRDNEVLLKIKAHFKNVSAFSLWDPKIDCCSWPIVAGAFIQCGLSGRVTILEVSKTPENATFEIPPIIGDLTMLEILRLNAMLGLTGLIPDSITKLANLRQLYISFTNISGPLPDLSGMKSLTVLIITDNKHFSGALPAYLHLLPNLSTVYFQNNTLTGLIPNTFGLFKHELSISLADNKLSGDTPKSLGQVKFVDLYLSNNQITGDASFLMGKDKVIKRLTLDHNQLEFNLSNIELPLEIKVFDISHNKIYGSLNEQFAQLQYIEVFNVSYNRLCGKIPNIPSKNLVSRGDPSIFAHNKCLYN